MIPDISLTDQMKPREGACEYYKESWADDQRDSDTSRSGRLWS